MPARKRNRRERTHEWQDIQQATLWPEQEVYERLRPIVLFGRQRPRVPEKQEPVNARSISKPGCLSKKAWQASFTKRERQSESLGVVSHRIYVR